MRKPVLRAVQPMLGILLVALVFIASPSTVYRAQPNYPGAALFTFQCGPSWITFLLRGTPVLQATFTQISRTLPIATATQQNQPIVIGTVASLWALKSDELQVHLNDDPEQTKLVLASGICGVLHGVVPPYGARALAYAQLFGPGQAVAYAWVMPSGEAVAYAQVFGVGRAGAFAQSSPGGTLVYVVQPGDNLFRVALRFNTTVSVLVALNNLRDPNAIYVGQVLRLP